MEFKNEIKFGIFIVVAVSLQLNSAVASVSNSICSRRAIIDLEAGKNHATIHKLKAGDERALIQKASFNEKLRPLLKRMEVSKQERVDTLCQIRDAIEERYALRNFKKEVLKLDPVEVIDRCANEEIKIGDNSRFAYFDRVRKCVASIRDSHLFFELANDLPSVVNGLYATHVKGKIYVSGIRRDILSYIESVDKTSLIDKFNGDIEVVSVDGRPALDVVMDLAKYEFASSEGAALSSAASSLFARNYKYPSKSTVKLTLNSSKHGMIELSLPWLSKVEGQANLDVSEYFNRIGIKDIDGIHLKFDKQKLIWTADKNGRDFIGLEETNSLYQVSSKNLYFFKDENQKTEVIRFEEVVLGRRKSFCYLQILSYKFDRVENKDGIKKDFQTVLEELLDQCEFKKLPLVLDLRNNPGGNLLYPVLINEKVKIEGRPFYSPIRSILTSQLNVRVLSQNVNNSKFNSEGDFDLEDLESIAESIENKTDFTRFLPSNYKTVKIKQYFTQKIVTLVSPDCASGCDITAALMKANKRSVLIGTHTNGTGAGFSTVNEQGAGFSDSRGFFKIKIPNFVFGIGQVDSGKIIEFSNDLILENRPTVADVQHSYSLEDINENLQEWRKITERALWP